MANYTFKSTFGKDAQEDLVPDTPTDTIGRYVMLVLQWEELTRRQAKYEEELRQLQAVGDALRAEWDALARDRQSCLSELGTLSTPPYEVIDRAWTLFKAHLWLLCQTSKQSAPMSQAVPSAITTLAEPRARDPRIIE